MPGSVKGVCKFCSKNLLFAYLYTSLVKKWGSDFIKVDRGPSFKSKAHTGQKNASGRG